MEYPLEEKIGDPELLVGREKEFRNFGKWIAGIPKRISKSRVILARRKSGKTSFVQRIFNQLWTENGQVIPFYLDIAENKIWYPHFAIKYYRAFASQYISFLERDKRLVSEHLSLEDIREYGLSKSIKSLVRDADFMIKENREGGMHGLMWDAACEAPHRFASLFEKRFLVILDEFQNLSQYIYPDPHFETRPIDTIPGSFHSLSESKIAPMLVTGSYVGWLIEIATKYLEAGRLSEIYMTPYLTEEDGLEAVYRYAEAYEEPVTNETAVLISRLCMSDPFFISCVMQSNYENRDLTTAEGAADTVNYEITDRHSEMSKTWGEYIQLTLDKVNDRHAKAILLHLSRHSDRYWTPKEIKEALGLEIGADNIRKKLNLLVEADVIEWGSSDIQFRGLQDGTLNLILRNRFEEEIATFVPDLRQEFQREIAGLRKENRRLRGTLNNLSGKVAEIQLAAAFRSRKRFSLSDFFDGVRDTARLNITDVRRRVLLQRDDGKNMELDVVAGSDCGRVAVAEVKKWKKPVTRTAAEDFAEKAERFSEQNPDKIVLPAFLALGGFTDDALEFCREQGIGTAEKIEHF
ncbi:hypothetical protein [Desulfonema magnum]|uniref:P-loop containing n=1 Tax=Desulfonema magnum TaxID=45655 RepID=A0A975BX23_9BACT|nr:hypothetical protein [Desulfonema magnum]QTA92755.1 p-loop containing [Desulfonema magnum]